MSVRYRPLLSLLPVSACLAACGQSEPPAYKVTYTTDIAPIIETHCVECHVPGQKGARESGLVMDSYESLMRGSQFGPVIEPGNALTSSLYLLVSGQSRLVVSMPHGKGPLTPKEIRMIRTWIDAGAVDS